MRSGRRMRDRLPGEGARRVGSNPNLSQRLRGESVRDRTEPISGFVSVRDVGSAGLSILGGNVDTGFRFCGKTDPAFAQPGSQAHALLALSLRSHIALLQHLQRFL
jgi:hypothetical protein